MALLQAPVNITPDSDQVMLQFGNVGATIVTSLWYDPSADTLVGKQISVATIIPRRFPRLDHADITPSMQAVMTLAHKNDYGCGFTRIPNAQALKDALQTFLIKLADGGQNEESTVLELLGLLCKDSSFCTLTEQAHSLSTATLTEYVMC